MLRSFAASLCFIGFFLTLSVQAQDDNRGGIQTGLLQINDPVHAFLLRQQTAGFIPKAFLQHQPLSAREARQYLDSLNVQRPHLSATDQRLLDQFLGNRPSPNASRFNRAIGLFYKNGRDYFTVQGKDYAIHLNPLLYLNYGPASLRTPAGDSTVTLWQNTRGVRVSGQIGKYIFFESRLEENQRRDAFPAPAKGSAPRLGVTIKFDADNQSYDYFLATGIVGMRSKFFEVRFGRAHNRWGAGTNSLFLSNYSSVYDQLQIRTTVGPVQYTNLFAAFNDLSGVPVVTGSRVIPQTYGAFHHLTIKITDRFSVDFFESIIFAPDTVDQARSGFDPAYLNPIIFYRAAEHDRGSGDNALLGAGFSWHATPGLFLYGQLLFDEFKFSELTSGEGWWGNKFGIMGGVHTTFSFFDVRAEYALIRPFMYAHFRPSTAYLNNDDLLGYQAGSNARSFSLFLRAQPTARLHAIADVTLIQHGRNPTNENLGGDPRLATGTRARTYGNELLQGVREDTFILESRLGYELLPTLFLEGGLKIHSIDDAELGTREYFSPFVQIRWGLPFRYERY